MTLKTRQTFAATAALFLLTLPQLLAHGGHFGGDSHQHTFFEAMVAGLLHPWSGLDHLLAMAAVGLWAAQLGGMALWLVPACFVLAMAGGSYIPLPEALSPFVESTIAASVLLLGLAVAAAIRLPVLVPAVLVAAFAITHGIAHGAEMPPGASRLATVLGFSLSTAVLHGIGLALGMLALAKAPSWTLRAAGGLVAATGLVLVIGKFVS